MAKERYSSETLLRVLLKNTEELEVKLKAHERKITELIAKPITVDTQKLEESTEKLNQAQQKAKDEYLKLVREEHSQFKKLVKGFPKWYLYANLIVFLILVSFGVYLYTKIEKQGEFERLENFHKGTYQFLEDNPDVKKEWEKYWEEK